MKSKKWLTKRFGRPEEVIFEGMGVLMTHSYPAGQDYALSFALGAQNRPDSFDYILWLEAFFRTTWRKNVLQNNSTKSYL